MFAEKLIYPERGEGFAYQVGLGISIRRNASWVSKNDTAAIFPQINPKNRYLHGFFPFDV